MILLLHNPIKWIYVGVSYVEAFCPFFFQDAQSCGSALGLLIFFGRTRFRFRVGLSL